MSPLGYVNSLCFHQHSSRVTYGCADYWLRACRSDITVKLYIASQISLQLLGNVKNKNNNKQNITYIERAISIFTLFEPSVTRIMKRVEKVHSIIRFHCGDPKRERNHFTVMFPPNTCWIFPAYDVMNTKSDFESVFYTHGVQTSRCILLTSSNLNEYPSS